MNNFTGLRRPELRRFAEYSADPMNCIDACNEILRREVACETDMRRGRRLMGDDAGINKIRDQKGVVLLDHQGELI